MTGTNITLSIRVFSEEDCDAFRALCDKHQFAYGQFAAIIVKDALQNAETVNACIEKMKQFNEDHAPASVEEMRALRIKLRQQEEELAALRQFKQMQLSALDSAR
jgi:hypothetical protein